MNRITVQIIAVAILLALQSVAADRLTLSTHVPSSAAHLPMLERLPATNRLELAIALPLRNQDVLANLARQIYDRRNTNFHCYLTPAQFAAQFGPKVGDYQKVLDYVRSNRMEVLGTYNNRALVDVAGSVTDIEKMFQVHLGTFQHPTESRQFFGPDKPPSVDSDLQVICVSGVDNYYTPHPRGRAIPLDRRQPHVADGGSFPLQGGGFLYGSHDFRKAYVPGSSLNGAGQVVGLLEFGGYTPADIQEYEATNELGNVALDNVMGSIPIPPGGSSFEVSLDIEMAIAMAPGLDQVNVYEGNNFDSILTEMATGSLGERIPNQLSSSAGMQGDASVQQSFLQFAVQGQSFFAASGDYGALITPDTTHAQDYANYMIYVGGTQLFMNGNGDSWSNEIVWHDPPPTNYNYFASTGGILTNVPIAEYQQTVEMSFNMGSTQHRSFPDIAMVARDILGIWTDVPTNGPAMKGVPGGAIGTSAASPLWAGYAALINQQAALQDKPSVGFLLPALYEIGEGPAYTNCLHDITNGNNTWYDSVTMTGSPNQFYATNGYDLCTGWGTPTGTNLINALVAYSGPIFVDFNYTGSLPAGLAGSILYPWKTLAEGTNAVSTGGTIFIINGGSSSETMTISKAMTITAQHGSATIGN